MSTRLLTCACLASGALAGEIHVPADYPTIQQAIQAAADSDEVIVAPGTYNERIDFLGKPITVRSAAGASGATIHGAGGGSVVTFASGEGRSSVLEGFTITGGHADLGGGVACLDASPTIVACLISGNSARNGGGIYASVGGLWVEDCTVDRNTAAEAGGGLWLGCCPANDMAAEFVNCVFTSNIGELGGGMYSTGGWFRFTGCRFEDNRGGSAGGAVALVTSGGNAFESCEFIANQAGWGGAVSQREDSEATYHLCTFRGNEAFDEGGAVFATQTSFPIVAIGCAFEQNTGPGRGGALSSVGAGIDVSGCVFEGNLASRGGAIGADADSFLLRIQGGRFTGNSALTAGGAIYHEYNTLTIADADLSGNSAPLGGAIHSEFGRENADRCGFVGNHATSGGGFSAANGSGTLADCTFEGNTATGSGGGVYLNELDGHTFERCTFNGNAGSGLYCLFSFPTIRDSVFSSHPASAVRSTPNDFGFFPRISGTLFCSNNPDIDGPYLDGGGNTFAPWCACVADWNADWTLNTQDVLAYLNDWVARNPDADINSDGRVDTRDFLAFLNLWVAGC